MHWISVLRSWSQFDAVVDLSQDAWKSWLFRASWYDLGRSWGRLRRSGSPLPFPVASQELSRNHFSVHFISSSFFCVCTTSCCLLSLSFLRLGFWATFLILLEPFGQFWGSFAYCLDSSIHLGTWTLGWSLGFFDDWTLLEPFGPSCIICWHLFNNCGCFYIVLGLRCTLFGLFWTPGHLAYHLDSLILGPFWSPLDPHGSLWILGISWEHPLEIL